VTYNEGIENRFHFFAEANMDRRERDREKYIEDIKTIKDIT